MIKYFHLILSVRIFFPVSLADSCFLSLVPFSMIYQFTEQKHSKYYILVMLFIRILSGHVSYIRILLTMIVYVHLNILPFCSLELVYFRLIIFIIDFPFLFCIVSYLTIILCLLNVSSFTFLVKISAIMSSLFIICILTTLFSTKFLIK